MGDFTFPSEISESVTRNANQQDIDARRITKDIMYVTSFSVFLTESNFCAARSNQVLNKSSQISKKPKRSASKQL